MALKSVTTTKNRAIVILSIILIGVLTTKAQGQGTASRQLPCRHGQKIFTRADSDTLFVLQAKWVYPDSITVSKNGSRLEPLREYRIAYPGNTIWLLRPLGAPDTLLVEYVYSPIGLTRSYAKRSLRELTRFVAGDDTLQEVSVTLREPSASSWTALRRSGSLVRSVQIGSNQDVAFESALSLQVEGKVGTNVDVVAALSDQNLPIQPEGTSESIRELDQVFVSVRSPHYNATIGDFELDLPGRRYDAYSRKLSGIRLGASSSTAHATVSAAISRGEFNTNRFAGEESVQGPYPLSGKNNETGIVVLAGTETVWLDGQVLRRGENNDYVIDYSAGQITFSSRRLITADSRIVVEFEYANDDYERQYWAARTGLTSSKLLSSGYLTYITERDDRTRPLSTSTDDEDRTSLERAGDSLQFAVGNSADSLGPGLGDYVRVDSSVNGVSVKVFVYVTPSLEGQPQGEWQVFFDDFGQGHGDYLASADTYGHTFFYFVGSGLGRYLPARRIPLPVSNELVSFRAERQAASGLNGNLEVALSNNDRNTYSQLNDADNQGLASALALGFEREELSVGKWKLRKFSSGVEGRIRGATFTDIVRSDDIEFDRSWAASTNRQATETIAQGNIGFTPITALSIRADGGLLRREAAFQSRRYTVLSSLRPSGAATLIAEHTSILSEDSTADLSTDWIRQRLEGNAGWKWFRPRAKLFHERQSRDSRLAVNGFRFTDGSIGSLFDIHKSVQIDAETGVRRDDARVQSGAFVKSSIAKSYGGEVRWNPYDIGHGSVRWMHRDKSFETPDSSSLSSDAGRLELLLAPPTRVVELNLTYDALKSRTEGQLQIFVPTQPGLGSYRLENGVYVPDDQGDYELVSRNTGSFEPSSEIKTNALLWFRPDEVKSEARELWQRFAFETEATLEEQTRLPVTLGLLLLDRSKLRTSETIDGRFSLRQDVHFNRLSRNVSLRLRGQNSAAQVSRYANGAQENLRRLGSLRARVRYSGHFRGESEITSELERSLFEGVSIASTDVSRTSASHDVVWSISDQWETGLQIAASEANDDRSRTQASVRSFAPRASYSKYRKGRVDSEFKWIHVTANRARLPQDLTGGANRGENYRWSLRLSFTLSENFTGSLNYTGRRDAGEPTDNVGRVEVRAAF